VKSKLIQPRKGKSLAKTRCRFVKFDEKNLRFKAPTTEGGPYTFSGYAVKWDSVNAYREQFVKGAFTDLINAVKAGATKVHQYYNHGWRDAWIDPRSGMRIGIWTSLTEDEIGFLVEGELTPNLSLADDVAAMLAHGTVDGLSICFFEPSPMDVQELSDRTVINRVDIYEISVVDEPADDQARMLEDGENDPQDDNDPDDMDQNSRNKQSEMSALLRQYGVAPADADKFLARFNAKNPKSKTTPIDQTDPWAFLDSKPA
jgi:HK97 family phage prohead protease